MRKLIILLLFVSSAAFGQVDNAVKQVVKPSIDSLKDAISKVQVPANVVWEEVLTYNVSRAGNIDTLTAPGIYELSVTGSATAVRLIAFNNGVIRTTNPMAWQGVGSLTTAVINGRVIVSTTATGITYQRRKL